MQQAYDRELEQLHDLMIRAAEEKDLEHNKYRVEVQRSHTTEKHKLTRNFENQMSMLKERIAQLTKDHASEKGNIWEECKNRERQLEDRAVQEQALMEEEYNTKLAKSDTIHNKVQAKFKKMVSGGFYIS